MQFEVCQRKKFLLYGCWRARHPVTVLGKRTVDRTRTQPDIHSMYLIMSKRAFSVNNEEQH